MCLKTGKWRQIGQLLAKGRESLCFVCCTPQERPHLSGYFQRPAKNDRTVAARHVDALTTDGHAHAQQFRKKPCRGLIPDGGDEAVGHHLLRIFDIDRTVEMVFPVGGENGGIEQIERAHDAYSSSERGMEMTL